jgi:hypothetical protein
MSWLSSDAHVVRLPNRELSGRELRTPMRQDGFSCFGTPSGPSTRVERDTGAITELEIYHFEAGEEPPRSSSLSIDHLQGSKSFYITHLGMAERVGFGLCRILWILQSCRPHDAVVAVGASDAVAPCPPLPAAQRHNLLDTRGSFPAPQLACFDQLSDPSVVNTLG